MSESATNPELQLAKELILETGCNLFLTGRAGTGKTTFLHDIRRNMVKRCAVCAPTGVAAINCGGVTLHSFFQLPFGPLLPGNTREQRFRFTRQKQDIIRNLDLLVIDEISMVRADMLDGVDAVLRRIRRNSKPFGGVQLLLIGDLFQLPPVVKDQEKRLLADHYDSTFFFGSKALRESLLYTIELNTVYRQEDPAFIKILNQIRENHRAGEALEILNSRCSDTSDNETITLCSHNRPADRINSSKLRDLSGKTMIYDAEVAGEFPEHSFPTDDVLELKKGAQVMFLRNDPSPEKRYFNGKIGRITKLSSDEICVSCGENEEDIHIERAVWDNTEYQLDPESLEIKESSIGTFEQFPLKLAWAITIHKSQGLTFDQAVIDACRAFAAGQVYVALSRCRSLAGLTLTEPIPATAVRVDPAIHSFFQNGVHTPDAQILHEAKILYQQQLLVDCFDMTPLQRSLNRLAGFLRSNGYLVTLKGLPDGASLRDRVEQEISQVGKNFLIQLKDLSSPGRLISEDDTIQERLSKADVYFQEKFGQIFFPWLSVTELETDNKELKRQGNKLLKELRRQVAIKLAGIEGFAKDFSPRNYLRAISRAELDQAKPPKKAKLDTSLPDDHPHQELLDTLKEWRKNKSREEDVAPFQIIHYKTLGLIALHLPEDIGGLKRIRGIGNKLSERYGEELLDMVAIYKREHPSSAGE